MSTCWAGTFQVMMNTFFEYVSGWTTVSMSNIFVLFSPLKMKNLKLLLFTFTLRLLLFLSIFYVTLMTNREYDTMKLLRQSSVCSKKRFFVKNEKQKYLLIQRVNFSISTQYPLGKKKKKKSRKVRIPNMSCIRIFVLMSLYPVLSLGLRLV